MVSHGPFQGHKNQDSSLTTFLRGTPSGHLPYSVDKWKFHAQQVIFSAFTHTNLGAVLTPSPGSKARHKVAQGMIVQPLSQPQPQTDGSTLSGRSRADTREFSTCMCLHLVLLETITPVLIKAQQSSIFRTEPVYGMRARSLTHSLTGRRVREEGEVTGIFDILPKFLHFQPRPRNR